MTFLSRLVSVLLPRRCPVCDKRLRSGERYLCVGCAVYLPRYDNEPFHGNSIVRRLWEKVPVRRAVAMFSYHRDEPSARALHALKYKGRYDACQSIAREAASCFLPTGFFDGIDVIVPIPLHEKRCRERGFNQAEWLAKGIAQATGLPVSVDWLWRKVHNPTQTHLTAQQRRENVKDIFAIHPSRRPPGTHVLVVDDVLTTGATMCSALETLQAAYPDLCFSVFTLAAVRPQ